jgi:DNA-binding response OmpR family regulator
MQKKILIVDFEQESIAGIQEILKGQDFSIVTAADGNQALGLFETNTPDLVLTAALLPKLNGFELCKKITSGELGEVRPVIMYSAIYKAEKYRKEAVSGCGAWEFLDKPIHGWQLLKAVKAALDEVSVDKSSRMSVSNEQTSASRAAGVLALAESGDLLEVDALFDDVESGPTTPRAATESQLLEIAPAVEAQPLVTPSPDSSEIDAALDSVRLDLDQAAQQRDDLLSRDAEQELVLDRQTVLEFEGVGMPSSQSTGIKRSELASDFELDEVLPELAAPEERSAADVSSEASAAAPKFTVRATESRNWLPFALLAAAVLIVALIFWLRR